jgi:hypothetical protein
LTCVRPMVGRIVIAGLLVIWITVFTVWVVSLGKCLDYDFRPMKGVWVSVVAHGGRSSVHVLDAREIAFSEIFVDSATTAARICRENFGPTPIGSFGTSKQTLMPGVTLSEAVFPLWPIWVAASIYPILVLVWIPRRRIRRRRGHRCVECGYDLTGNVSGACPECGEEVPTHEPAAPNRIPQADDPQ